MRSPAPPPRHGPTGRYAWWCRSQRADLGRLSASPESYLRRFHYDTIGYSAPVLDFLISQVGSDRILMGSDYCFPIAYENPVEIVTAIANLSAVEQAAVLETNARQLLRLPAAKVST